MQDKALYWHLAKWVFLFFFFHSNNNKRLYMARGHCSLAIEAQAHRLGQTLEVTREELPCPCLYQNVAQDECQWTEAMPQEAETLLTKQHEHLCRTPDLFRPFSLWSNTIQTYSQIYAHRLEVLFGWFFWLMLFLRQSYYIAPGLSITALNLLG